MDHPFLNFENSIQNASKNSLTHIFDQNCTEKTSLKENSIKTKCGFYDKNSKIWLSQLVIDKNDLEQISKIYIFAYIHPHLSRDLKQEKIVNKSICIPGIIASKEKKMSKNGNEYLKIELTGLLNSFENLTISCLLFGKCMDLIEMMEIGTLLYFVDPKIDTKNMNSSTKSDSVTIIPKSPDTIIHIGVSQDFGFCKASLNNSCKKCGIIINRARSELCLKHTRFGGKNSINRAELAYEFGRPVLKIGKDSNNSSIKSYREMNPVADIKSNDKKFLSDYGKPTNQLNDYIKIPTLGSRNLIKHNHSQEINKLGLNKKPIKVSEYINTNFQKDRKRSYIDTCIKDLIKSDIKVDYSNALLIISDDNKEITTPSKLEKCNDKSNLSFKLDDIKNIKSHAESNSKENIDISSVVPKMFFCCKTCNYKASEIKEECHAGKHHIIKIKVNT